LSATDDLVANNAAYASGFTKADLPIPPAKKVAVLACMDARLDPAKALGLQ
jgi:carbonic anhydrase